LPCYRTGLIYEVNTIYPVKKTGLVQLAASNSLQSNFLKQSFTNKKYKASLGAFHPKTKVSPSAALWDLGCHLLSHAGLELDFFSDYNGETKP